MARFWLNNGLPYVTAIVSFEQKSLSLTNVILDTGSFGTIFAAHRMDELGLYTKPTDQIQLITGIGGTESVVQKQIESIQVDEIIVGPIVIEVAAMQYGFPIDGILGVNFFQQAKIIIDFDTLTLFSKTH